jgi:hypothetical protein
LLEAREMHEIPPSKPTDAEDVVWGLQTAASLWTRGERSDAIAWLRRAAQAASDAADDDRALELARVAAELADLVGTHSATMAAAMPQAPAIPASEEASVSSHLPSVPPAEKVHAGMLDPWSDPPPQAAVPPPPGGVEIPRAPIAPPHFPQDEVVTSAGGPTTPSRPAPPRPAPGGSRKPPPLPPRALAQQAKKPPSPSMPVAASAPPPQPLVYGSAPPPVLDEPELEQTRPRMLTPVTPEAEPELEQTRPRLLHELVPSAPSPRFGEEEDEASSARTRPPVQLHALPDEPDESDDMAPTPIAPAVAQRLVSPAEETQGDKPALDLENVEAFSDLPDDARAEFAARGEIHVLAEGEEVAGFALAYVVEGAFDVAATMVDAPAVRLAQGAVLRSRGTTNEGVPMRIISASPRAVVACWSGDAVETAFSNCPWVEEDLRAASDRVMTLVGITIGPLGERLDQSLREEIVGRLTVRPLIPGEIVVNKGEAVPGLLLVGVGELELVDGEDVKGVVGSGDFLFATEVLGAGAAPYSARAGTGGALVMFGNRAIAQELMVTCPPLLEVFAGM